MMKLLCSRAIRMSGLVESHGRICVRRGLLGVALVALSLGSHPVNAQEQTQTGGGEGGQALTEVVVSGSRITLPGYQSPTPVNVVTQADLQSIGAADLGTSLNQLPSFFADSTPQSNALSTSNNGQNVADLRSLGGSRTLVLLDGRRIVPTNEDGTVDLNLIPSTAISQVEIVTGGASAAWGSDAVAGVVNIRLDKDLEGVRSTVQYGQSQYGDAGNTLASLAVGDKFADGRGHFLIATEFNKDNGVNDGASRDWQRDSWEYIGNPGTGPSNLIVSNTTLAIGTLGGVILGPAPLNNIQFGPGGTVLPYHPGSIVSGALQVGGDGANMMLTRTLSVPYDRANLLTHLDYDVGGGVNFYFDGIFAEDHAVNKVVAPFTFGQTINSGNPFIPASVQATMTANNISSFSLYRVDQDFGFITADTREQTFQGVFGFNGALWHDWTWDASYEYGQTNVLNTFNNLNTQNFGYAVNAVVNPANGQTVCQATLAGQAPGCVPINLFGNGSPSKAAIGYVMGTEFLQTTLTQEVTSLSTQGKIVNLPGGALTAALGAEYRKEVATSNADQNSIEGNFLVGDAAPVSGFYSVKEAFLETNAPVLGGMPFANLLSLNGAIRFTDYSTSGSVHTWKLGAIYEPIADIRLRATYSSDIRAPNIGELFTAESESFTSVTDPKTNVTYALVKVLQGGNPDLNPENATTKTYGIVYQPQALPGLRLSADWYDIRIKNAISSLGAQQLVDDCANGVTDACNAVTRDPATGAITQVDQNLINVADSLVNGADLNGIFTTTNLPRMLHLPGELTFRVVGGYVDHVKNSVDGVSYTEIAGVVGPDFGGEPHWRANGSVTWTNGPVSAFAQVRYVEGGLFNNAWTVPAQIANNDIPAVYYFDFSGKYAFGDINKRGLEVFAGVRNAFNKAPPVDPINFIEGISTNVLFYDVIGRYFYAGLRGRF